MEYYDRMTEVREKGNYEQWVAFFLRAIEESAEDAAEAIHQLSALHAANEAAAAAMGRGANYARLVLRYAEAHPILTIRRAAEDLRMSYNGAASAVKRLAAAGILVQAEQGKRNRTFLYERYLQILRRGTQLIGKE